MEMLVGDQEQDCVGLLLVPGREQKLAAFDWERPRVLPVRERSSATPAGLWVMSLGWFLCVRAWECQTRPS